MRQRKRQRKRDREREKQREWSNRERLRREAEIGMA